MCTPPLSVIALVAFYCCGVSPFLIIFASESGVQLLFVFFKDGNEGYSEDFRDGLFHKYTPLFIP
ncbi:hypothetical protein BN938_2984 [Mucinivorans hirudinis]|uniref:Uncharacterized protein n=1 Tax=Mucinivorans hirudinis TaxID=1433126 RepID=A0A060REV4_9BACT|nr:hypothetical protein BN938_2984 [Mucinivorans hirudinis]